MGISHDLRGPGFSLETTMGFTFQLFTNLEFERFPSTRSWQLEFRLCVFEAYHRHEIIKI
jgi:hypothetical protein